MKKTNGFLAFAFVAGVVLYSCNSAETESKTTAMDDTLNKCKTIQLWLIGELKTNS
ncbi:hypothetical protein BH20BAC1_BH20BAC1_29010 [soil metagenome]